MSDKHPRAHQCLSDPEVWDEDDCSPRTHKIVPADAIVIEAGEVDAIGVAEDGDLRADNWAGDAGITADEARAAAVTMLAVEKYRRAHPLVDEREVEALSTLILKVDVPVNNGYEWPGSWSRSLLATGRVHVDTKGAT